MMRLAQRQSRGRHGLLFRLLRALTIAAVLILLLPYLLVPLYRVVQPVSTPMLWRWLTGARVERHVVPIARMAPTLPLAVIIAEDARYCAHRGIDWRQIRDSIEEADDISEARGASTITQQTAKNLFLWPGRSLVRKALELPIALWIDLVLPKRRVLEIYLNIAEWGPNGEFGAEAAARSAFGKSARDLTASESALLAAILPNPRQRSARQPGPALRRIGGVYVARATRSPTLAACLRIRR
jgi:monofunctional biosynthetic peptidoglycan transglycosylase